MIMTPETWGMLSEALMAIPNCPFWLKEQAKMSYEELSKLSIVDATTAGKAARPTLEIKTVTGEYLNFLREQIRLNPRGPEWLDLMKSRLAALEVFLGKELLVATFYSKPHCATLRVRTDTNVVVQVEFD
jgi:hypothetical protein